jgi:hypothetical protein
MRSLTWGMESDAGWGAESDVGGMESHVPLSLIGHPPVTHRPHHYIW